MSNLDVEDTYAPYPYFNDDSKLTYVSCVKGNLFRATFQTDSGREDVVVKFVKRYGDKVHEHLASYSLDPELHKVVSLPGGWKAVIMNEVKGGSSLANVSEDKLVENDWQLFRATLKKTLKEKNFVHGDLGCQNIRLSGIDEVSMVSSLNLAYMHLRLEELFGGNE